MNTDKTKKKEMRILGRFDTIYGVQITELLSLYVGEGYPMQCSGGRTRLVDSAFDGGEAAPLRSRFAGGCGECEESALLALVAEGWGHKLVCGVIGRRDRTLGPILRPGSFVLIDERQRSIERGCWASEQERPIYFVEIRGGYLCGWCEMEGNELTVVPHPQSGCALRRFVCPRDAEIVGRVVAVAARLGGVGKERGKKSMAAAAGGGTSGSR